ncbi:group III truncated hemoglobin [Conexibacter arvalis]|uniref:Hemoglobin n=1 Tax=Conexibacter arvalis TaxID=912552 RepID=A0A840I8K6_9ACTN|nr:group III truncated hemoglobin [Conexibacter arvalis]MBB4660484.1 hemoglobin [Conexibacter arvalis]
MSAAPARPGQTTSARPDIVERDDLERLVRRFYGQALHDPVIGHLFEIAQMDLDAHVPTMVDFWQTIVLPIPAYRRSAFAVHVALHEQEPLTAEHFDRWLTLWNQTVDELFAGERAELAKARATRVARAFALRLAGRSEPLLRIERPAAR